MRGLALLFLLAVVATLAACSSSDGTRTRIPAIPEYNSFLGASEFIVGENRFPFALASLEGQFLENAEVMVDFFVFREATRELRFSRSAEFREASGATPHIHENGEIHEHLDVRNIYVVDSADFDSPGIWSAQFSITSAEGQHPAAGELAFNVLTEPAAPGVGELVPASHNLTVHDVDSIEEIDTHIPPDDMHDLSVAEALQEGKPFVVAWSTPMFCVSQICGPVLDEVIKVQDQYGDRVNFIHIEPWDLKVARSEGRLVAVPEFAEWELPSEPWVFVIDGAGRVAARYEGLVTHEELEVAVREVLDRSAP